MQRNKKRKIAGWSILAVLCVIITGFLCVGLLWKPSDSISCPAAESEDLPYGIAEENGKSEKDADEELYEKIYNHMKAHQSQSSANGIVMEDVDAEASVTNESIANASGIVNQESMIDFAGTNVQVEYVDEGDIVKNDGRYLYQILQDDNYRYSSIQIIDTQDGLKEVSRVGLFSNIQEFYVWKDCLVVVEPLWAYDISNDNDGIYTDSPFSKVHFYDITDRIRPKEINSFAVKGNYKTSRISDGYFYFFSMYNVADAIEKEDLKSYIPTIGGEVLTYDALYLPEDIVAASYLVMVSVDLEEPSEFTDKMAVVSKGNDFYVSENNIYILERMDIDYGEEGLQCDKTKIVRFSYEDGQIEASAEGCVDGILLDQFAMDEYNDYFRIITTVSPMQMEKVVDDFSGEILGYYNYEYLPETNSVYVLDMDLKVTGSISNLAEDEQVYSARFIGDTGYFVTYKQVDPLFSVDFSNPAQPKISGELKISGFSEYLHFYGENQLVGIGYETDEETGMTEGLKISMFDISNSVDVKETNKLVLKEYDYSDAFYNHHAVLISGSKNIIGFMAEGYREEWIREYGVYSYDSESGFKQMFVINCISDEYKYFENRGTYIDDTFYLLQQNGGVSAYDLNSGECIEHLEVKGIQ